MGLHRGYIGIMEKKMETTPSPKPILQYLRVIYGLFWDNGENGNYYLGFSVWGLGFGV